MHLTIRKAASLTSHNSMVWQCAVSPHHGIMASVGSSGTAIVKPFAHDDIVYTQNHRVCMQRRTAIVSNMDVCIASRIHTL
jgi:hypothetical protein